MIVVLCQEKENGDVYHCFTHANNSHIFIPHK